MLTKITDDLWVDLDEIISIDFLYYENDWKHFCEDDREYRFVIKFKNSAAEDYDDKEKYEAMKKALEERYNSNQCSIIKENDSVDPILLRRLDDFYGDLYLSVRAIRCLESENLHFIGDIVCNPYIGSIYADKKCWLSSLLKTSNFGRKSYKELISYLNSLGIHQTIDCPNYLIERKKLTNKDYDFVKIP